MSEVGGPKPGLMNIGEEAKPPFAVLPDPSLLFLNRSKRLAALAPKSELGPYLQFLATLTRLQHDIQRDLPAAALPPPEHVAQALAHGMPPISRALMEPDAAALATIDTLLARLAGADVPAATAAAIEAVRAADPDKRRGMAAEALKDTMPVDDLGTRALIAAGLQVHFARLAAMLVADDIKPVADGVCPVCGSPPMTSSVVGWPKAHNTRFCSCALCGTMWHAVRIKCLLCSAAGGIRYHSIEGQPDTVRAETCESCRGYVKILYQVNDPALDPLADDIATLGLDMLMAEEGWKRGGHNPFMLGY